MKTKKFLLSVFLCVFVFTASAFAVEVEDALTPCPEESFYAVLKLDDTQNLLKWLFSKEHIDIFMPLILASEESNEILGVVEMLSAFAENTPLKSAALLAGVAGEKAPVPIFKMAFTVKPEAEPFVKKIAEGSAGANDIAKLFLGKDNPIASFAESMIKVENAGDNILKVDNELFIKAQDNMIIAGLSADDVKSSLNALEDSNSRLFANKVRKFAPKDFAWIHLDMKTLDTFDEDDEIDAEEISKYLDKPLDVEFGFMRVPGKFLMSMAANVKDALTKEAFKNAGLDRYSEKFKGGSIIPVGAKNPIFALGGMLNIEGMKINPDALKVWKEIVKQAKNRFGISEDDLVKLFAGTFSFVLNDNVTAEGVKIPGVYISETGTDGAAEKIFSTLEKSQHFRKVQDGVLQIDSSVSPVSCFITMKDGSLGINFAELANITAKPEIKSALKELLETESISSMWIDFAGIQSWLLAPENGVLILAEPIARFSGQGELFDAVKELLETKLSVPSLSVHSDSIEVAHMEFEIAEDVKAENGFLAKLVKLGRKFFDYGKAEDKTKENK